MRENIHLQRENSPRKRHFTQVKSPSKLVRDFWFLSSLYHFDVSNLPQSHGGTIRTFSLQEPCGNQNTEQA